MKSADSKRLTDSMTRAFRLIEVEHGGCEDNTCDLSHAIRLGYEAIAIERWIGSGASSKEFDRIYARIPHATMRKLYAEELELFCGEMISVECKNCNAIARDEETAPDHCDSCGRAISEEVSA